MYEKYTKKSVKIYDQKNINTKIIYEKQIKIQKLTKILSEMIYTSNYTSNQNFSYTFDRKYSPKICDKNTLRLKIKSLKINENYTKTSQYFNYKALHRIKKIGYRSETALVGLPSISHYIYSN